MIGVLEQVLKNQQQIMRQLMDLTSGGRLKAEWYTAAECARLKGISQAVLTQMPWMKPLGGKGAERIAGRNRWHRSVVIEWLIQPDVELLELYGKGADKGRSRESGMARAI
jgi:hypothetical protein